MCIAAGCAIDPPLPVLSGGEWMAQQGEVLRVHSSGACGRQLSPATHASSALQKQTALSNVPASADGIGFIQVLCTGGEELAVCLIWVDFGAHFARASLRV